MGYYTEYSLTAENSQEDIKARIEEVSGYSDLFTGEKWKWYDHEEDCKAVSKEFPNVLIELEGIGEESPDLWRKYFKNGKMQICRGQITYPKFSEDLLK